MKNLHDSSKKIGFAPAGYVALGVMSRHCIVVICGWCKQFIEFKNGGKVVGVSHGCCPACFDKILKEGG